MKNLAILLLLSFFIVSCDEETNYYLQLNLENATNSNIEIELFPNEEYLNGTAYSFSDFSSGYNQTKFVLIPSADEPIFITKNLKIKPYELATNVFDSIIVKIMEQPERIIKFSIDTVINYHDNLFDSSSIWNFLKIEGGEPNMFNANPSVTDNYTFRIDDV